MTTIDKEIIRNDLQFMQLYIECILERHDLEKTESEIVEKFNRRMNDILNRLGAE